MSISVITRRWLLPKEPTAHDFIAVSRHLQINAAQSRTTECGWSGEDVRFGSRLSENSDLQLVL
jgi:hypothetical protein